MNEQKKAALPLTQVEELRKRLAELPARQPDTLSAKEAVAQLEAEIRAALARGYRVSDIAQIYSELGSLSASTLQSYLRELGQQRAQAPRRRRRPSASVQTPAVAPAPVAEAALPELRALMEAVGEEA